VLCIGVARWELGRPPREVPHPSLPEAGPMVSFSFVLDRGPCIDYSLCRFPGASGGAYPTKVKLVIPESVGHNLTIRETEITVGISENMLGNKVCPSATSSKDDLMAPSDATAQHIATPGVNLGPW